LRIRRLSDIDSDPDDEKNQKEEKKESKFNQSFNPKNNNSQFFDVYGKVHKITFSKEKGMDALIDINYRSPVENSKTQRFPPSTPNIFESCLQFAIIEESIDV
jgi:hypothetical protein